MAAVAAGLASAFEAPHRTTLVALPPHLLRAPGPLSPARSHSPPPSVLAQLRQPADETRATCRACVIASFASRDALREHFKSDVHLLNLKRQAKHLAPLTADQAEALFASLALSDASDVESLSASASGSSNDDDDDDDDDDASSSSDNDVEAVSNQPLITAATSVPGLCLTVYAAVASTRAELEALAAPQTWAVILYQAGHFAAAVYEGERCVQHRTEHRYVVRKKQGGAQSLQDEKSFKARSAGAMLRRHGEAEMRAAVAATLKAWDFARCQRVFLGVPARARRLFVGPDGGFDKRDPRLRRVPFAINRPTLAETRRVLSRLQSVWLSQPPTPKPTPKPTPPPPPPAPPPQSHKAPEAPEAPAFHALAIHSAARSDDVERIAVLAAESPGDLAAPDEAGSTPLHVALAAGALNAARALLAAGANPTARDFALRLPVHVCADAAARDVLRVHCRDHPTQWDWHKAGVEPASTAEQLEAKRVREKEKRAAAAARKRDAAAREKADAERAREASIRRCAQCSHPIVSAANACEQGGEQFCGPDCMRQRRRSVLAEAAERRMKS